ncbi:hypothetical protein [Streptomyces sp. NPDC088746]|uniref:hypothetical protein n=1 Tax=Streptomyces sp. NPDC088746 TaxID=3365885 RepID=UPI0038193BE7
MRSARPPGLHRQGAPRADQAFTALAARYDGVVPGLRKALRDSYLSSRAVGGGWGA